MIGISMLLVISGIGGLDSRNLIGEVERKRKNTPSMRGEEDVEGRGYEPVESSISKNLS